MNREVKIALGLAAGFLAAYAMPVDSARFAGAVIEALALVQWYAREHVLLCLVPAFFIAGAIGVFVSQAAVLKYFGPSANKLLSYGVASVSGSILAVCSCTVLPLFGGIYLRGAGLGPAVAFLYAGPAVNVLAIVLTARVLGAPLGIARAVGAVTFSVVIGALMHLIFLKDERRKAAAGGDIHVAEDARPARPLWQNAVFFFSLSAVLVFANWARPEDPSSAWHAVYAIKWPLTAAFGALLGWCLWFWLGVKAWHVALSAAGVAVLAWLQPGRPVIAFTAGATALAVMMSRNGDEMKDWGGQSWGFAKQITPLLLGGVLAAGFFLGSPERPDAGIVPSRWVQALVGDDPSVFWNMMAGPSTAVPHVLIAVWPVWTNFFASFTGALMYFATLTEVPILRGLMDSGMGQGPALALLLAGPALSLPSMLVIHSIMGLRKTLTFVGLVVVMATLCGWIFGVIMS